MERMQQICAIRSDRMGWKGENIMDKTIIELLIDAKLADNSFHAAGRLNVLQCYNLKTDDERIARCQLYKDWILAGENKTVSRLMAIAGKPAPMKLPFTDDSPVPEGADKAKYEGQADAI